MIHLDESDCFNAWLSHGDAPDVTPKIIDGKRKLFLSENWLAIISVSRRASEKGGGWKLPNVIKFYALNLDQLYALLQILMRVKFSDSYAARIKMDNYIKI